MRDQSRNTRLHARQASQTHLVRTPHPLDAPASRNPMMAHDFTRSHDTAAHIAHAAHSSLVALLRGLFSLSIEIEISIVCACTQAEHSLACARVTKHHTPSKCGGAGTRAACVRASAAHSHIRPWENGPAHRCIAVHSFNSIITSDNHAHARDFLTHDNNCSAAPTRQRCDAMHFAIIRQSCAFEVFMKLLLKWCCARALDAHVSDRFSAGRQPGAHPFRRGERE